MGINSRNHIERLKNGNFLIIFDYQVLKIYWNLTKERIEKVFRTDYPNEIPQYLLGHELQSCPNINHMKKFYLKKLNLQSMTQQLVYHKFFKKYTKNFFKKFETIKYLPGTTKIYFEAHRLLDTQIYNRSTNFSKSVGYDRLYNKLQCIEYDYLTKRCIIYELECDKESHFYILGMDPSNSLVYIMTDDEDKSVYKLDPKLETATL
jgi:hypothetical protein